MADEQEELESQASAIEFTNYVRQPNGWHFFNPQGLLDGLLSIVYPLRFLLWLVPVVFALGAISLMYHLGDFAADWSRLSDYFDFLLWMLLPVLTLWLVDEIARGLVARHFGFATPSFGVTSQARTSSLPCSGGFRCDASAPRPAVVQRPSAPDAVLFFGTTAIAWTMIRPSGSYLATVAV